MHFHFLAGKTFNTDSPNERGCGDDAIQLKRHLVSAQSRLVTLFQNKQLTTDLASFYGVTGDFCRLG